MLFNMILPGAVEYDIAYTGNYTDNRVNGNGTVRLNTSGLLTVPKKVTVTVYILAGGGGAICWSYRGTSVDSRMAGGGGGYQTIEVELVPGVYEIVIGTGGKGYYIQTSSTGWQYTCDTGGTTSAFGISATGGTGAVKRGSTNGSSDYYAGTAGSPNAQGSSPNGASGSSSAHIDGGDGYVELTFI